LDYAQRIIANWLADMGIGQSLQNKSQGE